MLKTLWFSFAYGLSILAAGAIVKGVVNNNYPNWMLVMVAIVTSVSFLAGRVSNS